MGRPSSYTQKVADTICQRLADGESLRTICLDDDMPSRMSVFRWLGDEKFAAFRDQYARAREEQADFYAESIVDIADEQVTTVRKGKHQPQAEDAESEVEVVYDSAAVARNRLRMDARKWYASKLAPKKYGDKVEQQHSGEMAFTLNAPWLKQTIQSRN